MILDRTIICKYSLQHYAAIFLYKYVLGKRYQFPPNVAPHLILVRQQQQTKKRTNNVLSLFGFEFTCYYILFCFFIAFASKRKLGACNIYFALDFEHIWNVRGAARPYKTIYSIYMSESEHISIEVEYQWEQRGKKTNTKTTDVFYPELLMCIREWNGVEAS